ncbi:N-glycosylase/DNA lyase [candidate division WOR-3 bacterium]|nr:N-glycosylase/DNA lyase [candidate division WOR-3 bacterium]MCK4575070.1 N-glycosylase/DNA lyase [candidate division WOR-3 bacterium]
MIKKEEVNTIEELTNIYLAKKSEIKERLHEFKRIWNNGNEEDVFAELVFCILTPQSRAKSCWNSIQNLLDKNLLLKGNTNKITRSLSGVRFKYKKAEYVIEARKLFIINGRISVRPKIKQFNNKEKREWLVQNVKGIGYKEASHFLRNIGFGENLAILDRHILKNLNLVGLIEKIPGSLSRKIYIKIEERMKEFANKINIPISHLDFVLWYKETGEIFK